MQKYNKNKKQQQKDQQTIKCFDKLYRKMLQDNVINKNDYESLCSILTKYLDETKMSFFINMKIKQIKPF